MQHQQILKKVMLLLNHKVFDQLQAHPITLIKHKLKAILRKCKIKQDKKFG